ncbi:MAG: TIGR02147 family protein [Fibrobacterota bacterium]
MNIFEYLDYRKYLSDFYHSMKESHAYFSYRFMGRSLSIDPGYLVKVLQGKYHLTLKKVPAVTKLCGLSRREERYFSTLIQFNKAKSEEDTRLYFERLLSFKELQSVTVLPHQYRFYTKWYYSAVRSLLGFYSFEGDYAALARKLSPAITEGQARESIELLSDLDLIRRDERGRWHLTDTAITTGDEWRSIAVKNFQKETISLAGESLDRHTRDERDISTLTVAVAREDLADIKEIIREFRKSIVNYVNKRDDVDSVYEINIQMIPLTEKDGE